MNVYDSNRILDLAKSVNYHETKNFKESDCFVINTCHIREKASEKLYHEIGRLKKNFKNKNKPILIISGCVAQAESDLILKKEKYVDAVVGPQAYHQIPKILKDFEKDKNIKDFTDFDTVEKFDTLKNISSHNNKISQFLTIQEGCDKFCKFCVVPYTRGPEYSRPFNEIINEAKNLVSNGAKEIVLIGQNVNAYNYKKSKLSNLIYELSKLEELKRIRYTTSHPKDMSLDLIQAHKDCSKLMPILHLPIQSGSSKILKDMNRNHNLDEYLTVITKLRKSKPNIKFSSDFIIAYPGETHEDFQMTLNLMKKIKFINSYSFLYSRRPGTPAAELEEVNNDIAKQRLIEFQKIADEIKNSYRSSLVNTISNVLIENRSKQNNRFFGRDEFSNSVIVESEDNLIGKIINVTITGYNNNTLFAKTNSNKIKNAAA
tara:strand:- start:3008 stop:4300 length:1293 start_codon:yes stop_codon:yes gene_type:complete